MQTIDSNANILNKYGIETDGHFKQNFVIPVSDLFKKTSGLWLNPMVLTIGGALANLPYLPVFTAISFVASPIFNYYNPESMLPVKSLLITEELENHPITDFKLVKEIKNLAQKAGIEKKIHLYESDTSLSIAGAFGNNMGGQNTGMFLSPAVIFPNLLYLNDKNVPISSAEISGIPDNPIGKKIRSFLIAHELGHVKNSDILKMDLIQSVASLALFSASVLAPLSKELRIGMMLAAFIATPIFKCIYLYHREYQADLFAAELLQDTEGGIAFFKSIQEMGLKARNDSQGSWISRVYNKVQISPIGDNRFDFTHPFLSKRITNLQSYQEKKLVSTQS